MARANPSRERPRELNGVLERTVDLRVCWYSTLRTDNTTPDGVITKVVVTTPSHMN